MNKIVLITGGFDPVHSGHIAYMEAARELGTALIVGLNSDDWLKRKKGKAFMSWSERAVVLAAMRVVDAVIDFDDEDGSALDAITKVRFAYPDSPIVFANGGDRTSENIPEMQHPDDDLVFVFGVGGEDKKNSSSTLLKDWKK